MAIESQSSRSFYAPAVILAVGAEAKFFDRKLVGGKTLLERTILAARRCERVTRTIVVTHDRPIVKAAESFGADGIIVGHDQDPLEATEAPPIFVTSIAYPFLRTADYLNAARAVESEGLWRYSMITTARRHPLGSFRAKDGKMDFATTLDREDWRELDRLQCVVPHPHLLTLMAARTEAEAPKERIMVVDEVTSFRIEDETSLQVAEAIVAAKLFDPDAKVERTWRVL